MPRAGHQVASSRAPTSAISSITIIINGNTTCNIHGNTNVNTNGNTHGNTVGNNNRNNNGYMYDTHIVILLIADVVQAFVQFAFFPGFLNLVFCFTCLYDLVHFRLNRAI